GQITERRNRAYTRHRHEATHLRHAARQAQDLAIQIGDLPSDSFSCFEQRLDSSDERWLPIYQLGGPRRERVQLAPPNNKPEVLEQSSDLVLEIPFQLDEQGTAAEKGSDGMAIKIFDANLLVPTALHDAGDADGIVAIALGDLHL